jgi:hypothetical protein
LRTRELVRRYSQCHVSNHGIILQDVAESYTTIFILNPRPLDKYVCVENELYPLSSCFDGAAPPLIANVLTITQHCFQLRTSVYNNMNDASLDDHIIDATSEAKKQIQNQSGQDGRPSNRSSIDVYQTPAYTSSRQDPDDGSFTMPTKWWYASTAFPLITGTFGPMANAFSICALVENWRIAIPQGEPDSAGTDIPDPTWLIAVNAVSLVFALIANMSLLLNMTQRLKFTIAQPITIIGFWMSSVLLIALIVVASYDFHAPGVQDQALTQAYYYACWAAGLYQIISYLMCMTILGAIKKKYDSKFNLTVAQRTLMLQTIAYFTYLLLGALVFSKIEGWRFLDAVYWADFTLVCT